jgi:hypothetical protein
MKLSVQGLHPRSAIGYITASTYRVVCLLAVVAIILIGLFLKTSVYDVVVSPRPIDDSEISARQQRVNISLFQTISAQYDQKKQTPPLVIDGIKNPFTQ